jgi:hypothetical protein
VFALVDGANWAEMCAGIGTLVLTSGVFVAARQIRDERRVRVATLLTEFSRRWDEPRLTDVRLRLEQFENSQELVEEMRRCDREAPALYQFYSRELNYFEELGFFYRQSVVRARAVDLMLGTVIRERWNLWSPVVQDMRKSDGVKSYFEHFEKLAKRLQRRHDRPLLHWLITPEGQTPQAGTRSV